MVRNFCDDPAVPKRAAMKNAVHIPCLLALALGCAPAVQGSAQDAREQATPVLEARTEPATRSRPLTAEEIAKRKERGNDPLFAVCEPESVRGFDDASVSVLKSIIRKTPVNLFTNNLCDKSACFHVFAILSVDEFEAKTMGSSDSERDASGIHIRLPPLEEWFNLKARLLPWDELWVASSGNVEGFFVVRNDKLLCFTVTDFHGY